MTIHRFFASHFSRPFFGSQYPLRLRLGVSLPMLTTASFLAAALLLNACGGKSTPPPPPQPPVEMPVQQPLITAPKYATALAEGLKASTSGETGCTFSWTIQGGQFKDGSQGVTGAEIEFSAGPEGVILLECKSTNAKGKGSLPTRYEIQIVAAPKIESFKAAKTPITAGGEARLTAVFSGGSGLVEGVGSVQSGVAFGTGPLMERREFQLTVTNDAGSKVTQRLSVDVIPSPGIFAFSAAKPILTAGQSTTLTAVFEGTGAIEGLGPVQSGVALPTGVLNESRHFILNVLNAAGDAVRRELKVDVVAPPVIDGFEVDKPILTKGKVAQLKAVFKNGRGEIKGLGVVQSSVQSGVPLSTGILLDSAAYQLVVTNAAGDFVARECAVKVVEAPHIQSFSVHKPTVTTGEGASLIAHFSGGKGSLEGLGPIFSEVAFVTAGLNAARSFTLNVTNDAGDITSRSVSVDVVLPPTIESFVATKSPVTQGTATHLTAHFSGGTGRINGTELVKSGVALPTGILSESKVFTLVVTNAAGAIAQKDLKIEVIDPPSIQSFSAIQSILTKGKATSLTAEFKGGKGHIENVGDIVSGGSLPSGPLDATRKFKLTVTNEAGTEIHQFAEIRVVDEPKIQSFTASASQITEGDPVTLSYQFSGGKATIQGLPGELISGGSSTVQPKESITYVLTVTNDAKDSVTEQRDVKVFAAPVIHAFSGGGLLNPGETTTLTAEFSGGKGVINQDIGPVESGFSIVTEPLSQGRIYTLTVTNDAGGSVRAHRVVAMPQTLAGGAFHSLQVMSDGTVRAWGSNTYGALGIKNHAAWGSPLAIPDLKGIRSVSADNNFSLALDEKGHVWSWGKNDVGQLGNGTTKNRSTPAPIPGLENVVALKASARHALFLTVDGKVWAVGTCDYLPDHINTRLPVCIQELDGVLSIAAGMENSFALKGDGSVWAWGYGPLGDGSGSSQGKPVQVKELSGIVALAAKGYCSMALKEDGTVWSWGNNAWGQLGYPAEAFSEVPAQIPELTGVVNIWAGCYSGLAQKSDDSLYFWGELGGSFGVDGLISKTPAPLPGLADFKCLGVGYSHCLALQSDGRLLSLGDNQAGQLGDGTVKPVMLPVPLEGLPKFKDVAGGGNFSLALDEEGNPLYNLYHGWF